MKYLMLAYTNAKAWEQMLANWDPNAPMPAEVQAACEFYERLGKELTESGEFVSTEGLADPSHTKTVRKTDEGVVATDGPYAEVKEVVGGIFVLRAADYDEAIRLASDCPHLDFGRIDVRQVDFMGRPEP
jgi:hypothetical protein